MTFLYKANATRGMEWARCFAARAPDLPFRLWPDIGDAAQVRYLAVWTPPENIAATFRNLELVFSVGAGVDQFDFSRLPPHVPLIRMLEPGIAESMVEYVTMAVLALHRDLLHFIAQQREQTWREIRIRKPRNGALASWASACSVRRCLNGSKHSASRLRVGTVHRAPFKMSAVMRAGRHCRSSLRRPTSLSACCR